MGDRLQRHFSSWKAASGDAPWLPRVTFFTLLCLQGNFGGKVWEAPERSLAEKKNKEAQRDTRISAQVKGGDKPSELPLVSRTLMICQALCKVFTCMVSINHCNSPALKKQKNKKPFFLQMRKLGHRENNFPKSTQLGNGLCASAKLLQSCLTLCNPMDCNPPGSSVYGILQAEILEWVAMPSSRRSSWPREWAGVS